MRSREMPLQLIVVRAHMCFESDLDNTEGAWVHTQIAAFTFERTCVC